MAIKNIVIPLEVEYLQKAAKERGISRSKLVRFVMEKVVNDDLVPAILGNDDLVSLQLALAPMMIFAIGIKDPFDVTVQRFHDADPRQHRRTAAAA